jgi:flagellar basal-body rod modification protein FlgD
MEVASTPTASTAAASTAARVNSTANEAREDAISDFNDFLTLLTAQLKNQDPLQPLDSTQFVEQLASFSSVEQQVGANEKLDRLIEQGASQELSELGGWIGQAVEAESALFELDSEGLSLPVPSTPGIESAEARITDADGEEVGRVSFDPALEAFEWSGDLDGGGSAAPGQYGIAFSFTDGDGRISRVEAGAVGSVAEARVDSGGPLLTLDTGAIIRPSDIIALRATDET